MPQGASLEDLDLLLSVDASLQIIHVTHDGNKRPETFAEYPSTMSTRVRDTFDEVFCEMLRALGMKHIVWGFGM